ncbi:hypothetical protein BJX63DRAFT_395979 [Aspergillus granulosus]|uniref:Secreted protein n=1 Tax=Aspergillus granulosus TaxID=176169 RepID=A0ABR4HB83_9EURO
MPSSPRLGNGSDLSALLILSLEPVICSEPTLSSPSTNIDNDGTVDSLIISPGSTVDVSIGSRPRHDPHLGPRSGTWIRL